MYQTEKDIGTLVKRFGRMIYLVKGAKTAHLNHTKSRHTDEENDIPVDVEPIEVLFRHI